MEKKDKTNKMTNALDVVSFNTSFKNSFICAFCEKCFGK